ncbi:MULTISPECIES: tripartite tricarboxylate transporter TctB family protein [unclassified Devosia]|uniref:tripartite tricarboxylate transporter TctB family protein n=1 Tax=unclassified Devosia TaxID=196773 RepID=UPI00145CA42E|nr:MULTISPECIES: tripartite tricarboxylate transporter TctB family protein [unclassified Devosia]MBJ6987371.1 tripartite tricarboxylate transporter TctB family protein [Devosia sp. MC521]MBJ7578080.1 tripartite tricarboxylate transporter TctB family protein [Devosia sp. MC532]MBK1794230.1 tripartite tricarboxylate transporter TctB family protein [Devosia sp. WQ 349K1]QMW63545.1 tripartite tricarboxylate transporter TctB family protein [Devosia sp. MC521]
MINGSPQPTRRPDGAALIIGVILAIISAVIFWQTSQMRIPPIQQKMGPHVFPYVIATGLALLSVGTFISAARNGFPERSKDDIGPILWVVGGLVAQILLLSTAGFSIATGLLFAFTAKAFGRGPLWQTIPIGIVFAFVVWFIFAKGLQLSLPMGVLERFLTTGSFV